MKTNTITIRVDAVLYEEIKAKAAADNTTVADLTRDALQSSVRGGGISEVLKKLDQVIGMAG